MDVAPSAAFGLCLLELELIEPSLYFRMSEVGASRFADALLRRLRE